MSWAAPTEPAVLSIAGATYPVFFTYGQEDRSLQITIVCASTSTEFTTTLPATTVEILASAAKCDAASHAFQAFLIDHVRLRVDGRTRAFFLGSTRFHDRHFDAGRVIDAEHGSGKRLVRQFGDVVRSLADQRTLQERIMWSNQQLMDTLVKGFEHMQELAARFVQHDMVVTQLAADVQQWRRVDMERYRDWMQLQQHDHRTVEELEERLHEVLDRTQSLVATCSALETSLKVQLQDAETSSALRHRTLDVETTSMQQHFDDHQVLMRREMDRLRDALGLLNDAHCNTSKQLATIVSQMDSVDDLAERVSCTAKLVAQLRQDHMDMLPKLQEMYVGERRREAIAAIDQLNFSALKPPASYS